MDLDSLRGPTRSLTGIREYATSKLCVMLFALELARRFEGTDRRSVVADPGDVASDAYRHVPWPVRAWMTRGMRSVEEGAETPVFCATDGAADNGALYADRRPRAPSPLARDEALACELWDRSERWTMEAATRAR